MSRKLVFGILILACLLLTAALGEGVNRALLVGCDSFVTQEDTTPASANNVTQMASVLLGGDLNLEKIVTRRQGLGSVEELKELVEEAFGEADAGDVSYFYISTHGLWTPGQDNGSMTLVLSDGFQEEGLTARQLRDMLDRVPGIKVLMLDACHSGAMIGKGVYGSFVNLFEGDDYKVLCSSGGTEESWFWSGMENGPVTAGAGYFSGSLSTGLGSRGGFAADENRDGCITLTELKRYLRANHGASTVQTYPEEDDFAVMTYDVNTFTDRRQSAAVENLVYEDSVLSLDQPEIDFSFTVTRDVQVAYQLVYQRDGHWDFGGARLEWDDAERYGIHGDAPGWLTPGYKERTIHLNLEEDDLDGSGYVLLQVLMIENGRPTLVSSRLLTVPPAQGDPNLGILTTAGFTPELGQELTMVVEHSLPCELTVTIETLDGAVVRRLLTRAGTRPEQLNPRGTTVCWNGLTQAGSLAPEGEYVIHVRAYIGEGYVEVWSAPIQLRNAEG